MRNERSQTNAEVMLLTDEDKTNLEYSIHKTMLELKNDNITACIYEGREMLKLINEKIVVFEKLLEKVRKM